jgi:hypothetical protein
MDNYGGKNTPKIPEKYPENDFVGQNPAFIPCFYYYFLSF